MDSDPEKAAEYDRTLDNLMVSTAWGRLAAGRNWPARLQRLAAPEPEAPHAERRRARAVLLDVGGLLRGAAFVFLRGRDCVRTSLLLLSRRAPTGLTRIYGTRSSC